MTDAEKAEFINEMTEKIYCWLANEKQKIKQAIKEGLEKGLAEGRKEGYAQGEQMLMASGEVVKKGFLDRLEKENKDNCIDCEYVNLIIDKDKQIFKLKKELTQCRESALKELLERVEKDQLERQVQTINVLDLKSIIKEMGVEND